MRQETTGRVTEDTPITITKFTANPSAGPTPLTVAFHAEAQGGLQPYSQWTFDFGDGMVVDVPNGFGQSAVDISHTYQREGQPTVQVTVWDDLHNFSTTATLVVTVTQPQVWIKVTVTPSSGKAPFKVVFDTMYGGGNLSAYVLKCDFGDGQSLTRRYQPHTAVSHEASFDHTYTKPNKYVSTVCIDDAVLNEACQKLTIIVN